MRGVFYTGLLPQLVPDGAPHVLSLVLLVLTHVPLTLAWLLSYGALVGRAAGVFQHLRVRQTLDRVTGVVLIGFGARVALTPAH